MSKSPQLRLHVDQEKCQGHARCKSLAPELFDLDEFGNAHERGDGSVPAGLEDKTWVPRSQCPENAIQNTQGRTRPQGPLPTPTNHPSEPSQRKDTKCRSN